MDLYVCLIIEHRHVWNEFYLIHVRIVIRSADVFIVLGKASRRRGRVSGQIGNVLEKLTVRAEILNLANRFCRCGYLQKCILGLMNSLIQFHRTFKCLFGSSWKSYRLLVRCVEVTNIFLQKKNLMFKTLNLRLIIIGIKSNH